MSDVHKLLIFMKRRPGMTVEAFRDYYENQHVPLCMRYMAGPVRYLRRYIEQTPGQPEPEYDVITEIWFNDKNILEIVRDTMLRDAMPADVIADELALFDRARCKVYAVTECETPLTTA